MGGNKLQRIERALRGNRRNRPKIAVFWRVCDDEGHGLVRLEDGTLLDEDFYFDELRKQGNAVIVVDWRT